MSGVGAGAGRDIEVGLGLDVVAGVGIGAGSGAELAMLRWPEVPARPLVLVPLGSTEQHGPHLPFDTDSVIATAVARSVADELGAVVAPTVSYGASGEHQDFPGTVSIGHVALETLIVELVRSLMTWAGRVVLVNGHGGNVPTLATVVPRLIGEQHDLAWIPCGGQEGDAHAGRTETSLMLHLLPDRVDLAVATAGETAPIADLLPRLSVDGVRAVSPSGVLGDPSGASATEGATMLVTMVTSACRRIASAERDDFGLLRDPGPDREAGPTSAVTAPGVGPEAGSTRPASTRAASTRAASTRAASTRAASTAAGSKAGSAGTGSEVEPTERYLS